MAVSTLLQIASVTISAPTSNETVSSPFEADGTYSAESPSAGVMWQVQPEGDPPSSTGWQPTSSGNPGESSRAAGPGAPRKPGRRWQCQATSTAGAKTFYVAVFEPGSQSPAAIASVDVTVS